MRIFGKRLNEIERAASAVKTKLNDSFRSHGSNYSEQEKRFVTLHGANRIFFAHRDKMTGSDPAFRSHKPKKQIYGISENSISIIEAANGFFHFCNDFGTGTD